MPTQNQSQPPQTLDAEYDPSKSPKTSGRFTAEELQSIASEVAKKNAESIGSMFGNLKNLDDFLGNPDLKSGVAGAAVRELHFQGKHDQAHKLVGDKEANGYLGKAARILTDASTKTPTNGLKAAAWGIGGTLAFDAACTAIRTISGKNFPVLGFVMEVVESFSKKGGRGR